jgi:hypothetical protein
LFGWKRDLRQGFGAMADQDFCDVMNLDDFRHRLVWKEPNEKEDPITR